MSFGLRSVGDFIAGLPKLLPVMPLLIVVCFSGFCYDWGCFWPFELVKFDFNQSVSVLTLNM